MSQYLLTVKYLSILLIGLFSVSPQCKEIDKARSIYRNVVIDESDGLRCMRFENHRMRKTNQACIDLKSPNKLVFEYNRAILAGFAYIPTPKRILIIGLGGGTLSQVMHEISPDSEIVSVEIDPVVVKFAKQYFNYQESSLIQTVVKDGRIYVKRALLKNEKFDWIVLDAFNGDYIPEHLMTVEFLTETKKLLTENGLLSANTFSASQLFHHESSRISTNHSHLYLQHNQLDKQKLRGFF